MRNYIFTLCLFLSQSGFSQSWGFEIGTNYFVALQERNDGHCFVRHYFSLGSNIGAFLNIKRTETTLSLSRLIPRFDSGCYSNGGGGSKYIEHGALYIVSLAHIPHYFNINFGKSSLSAGPGLLIYVVAHDGLKSSDYFYHLPLMESNEIGQKFASQANGGFLLKSKLSFPFDGKRSIFINGNATLLLADSFKEFQRHREILTSISLGLVF